MSQGLVLVVGQGLARARGLAGVTAGLVDYKETIAYQLWTRV
jgi:hypothetical protein